MFNEHILILTTGKTLLAFKLAKEAINNNWTFIYLKDPTLLAKTLKLSKTLDKNGHGVIVFVEDIDQVTRGNRDTALQDILNTLDGGDTKNMNVISLFTTNHIELIEPTFLRGKRIGSVVSLGFLDAETAKQFLQFSFNKENYKLDEDLDSVASYIEKHNIAPAFMAEIIESIKSKMIFMESDIIKSDYIKGSVDSYLRQVSLSQKKDMSQNLGERFSSDFAQIVVGSPLMKKALRNNVADVLLESEMISDGQHDSIIKKAE